MLFLELAASVLADEVILLALPLKRRCRRDLREADMSDRVLDHLILQVDFILAHREVRLHELNDPVVDPLGNRFLVDRVQREFHLVMRLEVHQDGDNVQVVTQDQLLDVPVRRCREFQTDPGNARLKVESRLSSRRRYSWLGLDSVPELLHEKFQARSPNCAQLVEHLCELLQTLLPVFMPLHLFNLELLDLVFDCRKLGVDPAGETVDVRHDGTSSNS